MKRLWLSGALLLSAVALSACGGGGGNDVAVVTPPAAAAFEDQFGSPGFGPAFRINANAEPQTVGSNDLISVSLTTEPVALR